MRLAWHRLVLWKVPSDWEKAAVSFFVTAHSSLSTAAFLRSSAASSAAVSYAASRAASAMVVFEDSPTCSLPQMLENGVALLAKHLRRRLQSMCLYRVPDSQACCAQKPYQQSKPHSALPRALPWRKREHARKGPRSDCDRTNHTAP